MKFTLKIKMGSDAMLTTQDIAKALRGAANELDRGRREAPIADVNGNTVGNWVLK